MGVLVLFLVSLSLSIPVFKMVMICTAEELWGLKWVGPALESCLKARDLGRYPQGALWKDGGSVLLPSSFPDPQNGAAGVLCSFLPAFLAPKMGLQRCSQDLEQGLPSDREGGGPLAGWPQEP